MGAFAYYVSYSARISIAFDSFGGALGQFNNIGILLGHAVCDSPALEVGYAQYLRRKLGDLVTGAPRLSIISRLFRMGNMRSIDT